MPRRFGALLGPKNLETISRPRPGWRTPIQFGMSLRNGSPLSNAPLVVTAIEKRKFFSRVTRWPCYIVPFAWCLVVGGCSSSSQSGVTPQTSSPVTVTSNGSVGAETGNSARLEALWTTRHENQSETDYPIGPGDVLLISAQQVDELNHKVARVSGDGVINLPLIGVVRAGGLHPDEVSSRIADRLKQYLYNPQVQVFVQEFHSRRVAVIGAARKPGVLTLTDSNETILDAITLSGGTTPDAGDKVLLFPAEDNRPPAEDSDDHQRGEVHQVSVRSESALDGLVFDGSEVAQTDSANYDVRHLLSKIPPNSQPIVIDLKSRSLAGGQYLNLPVRPGDIILIPGGGDVMVVGWVETPGHFKVGSGLTVLGAIGAAGGPMYAANLSEVQLIRTDGSNHKQVISIDVNAIQEGDASDPKVIANDVINVPYSSAKIGPYVFYNILTRIPIGLPVP